MTTMVVPLLPFAKNSSSTLALVAKPTSATLSATWKTWACPILRKIDIAIPANCRVGRPEDDAMPVIADWGPVRQTYAGLKEVEPQWVAENLPTVHILDVARARRV